MMQEEKQGNLKALAIKLIDMKKKLIYSLVGFITFVIIINYVPFMRIFVGEYWYYSNYDGSYREFEALSKGRTLIYIKKKYKLFLEQNPDKSIDTNLYINDKKNYFKFWNYKDYSNHPRWELKYKPLDSLNVNSFQY